MADLEKQRFCIKITMMNSEGKDKVIKSGILFSGKRHGPDGFTEISKYTICIVCCHWGPNTLQCPYMERPQCQLSVRPHTAKNYRCMANLCREFDGRECTHTAAGCTNCRGSNYATSPIYPVRKQAFIIVRSGIDKQKGMELERQRKR